MYSKYISSHNHKQLRRFPISALHDGCRHLPSPPPRNPTPAHPKPNPPQRKSNPPNSVNYWCSTGFLHPYPSPCRGEVQVGVVDLHRVRRRWKQRQLLWRYCWRIHTANGARHTAHSMPMERGVPIRPLSFSLTLPHTYPCVLYVICVLCAVR